MKKINPDALNLKQFLLRTQVLGLYRNILRTIKEVPGSDDQKYLLQWVQKSFKENKHHTDNYIINMQINSAERFLRELKQNLALSK